MEINKEISAQITNEFENSSFAKNLFFPWIEEIKKELMEEGIKILEKDGTKSKLSIISGKYRFIEMMIDKFSEWKREYPKVNQNQRQG